MVSKVAYKNRLGNIAYSFVKDFITLQIADRIFKNLEIMFSKIKTFADPSVRAPVPVAARSKAARLLRSWVRIPLGAWMFVCC